MNKGKAKCERLKRIRKAVADKIGVDLHQTECTFQGDCTGTCPKCKHEEEMLNRALLTKASAVAIAGVASMSLAACGPINEPGDIQGGMTYSQPLEGGAPYVEGFDTGAPHVEGFDTGDDDLEECLPLEGDMEVIIDNDKDNTTDEETTTIEDITEEDIPDDIETYPVPELAEGVLEKPRE